MANRFQYKMINDFRFSTGQFQVNFFEFSFTGTDVVSFLDSQSTFDVKNMGDNSFHLTTFLDPQGRMETYGWLIKVNQQFSYLVPTKSNSEARSRLNRFLVSEDVEIEEKGVSSWHFLLGKHGTGASGFIFDEDSTLQRDSAHLPTIPAADVELWRKLNGWPSFDGSDYSHDLVTNLRLFDLAVTMNKGCYPGQETVSKIATRRGAAYAPVLIETDEKIASGNLLIGDNKIGTAEESLLWNQSFYTPANLLRDFRVEGMKINFVSGGKSLQGHIRYYPLLKATPADKAQELYDSGLSHFRSDDLFHAEKDLSMALKFNPHFADAYEALGVMLGRQERFQEAIALMQKLTEVDPDSTMAHTNLSLFLMKTGNIEEAENHKSLATMKSFKKFGDEAREKEASAAKLKAESEEWARREKMFREVLEIDPEDTLANYGLGSIAVEKGEWGIAKEYLVNVIKADPKYSVAYLALGKAYKGLGMAADAKNIFAEGIKVAAAKGDFMPANQMQSELDRL